jgi:2-keto-3-deoxy-L-rhamnonate aldolase RhmA
VHVREERGFEDDMNKEFKNRLTGGDVLLGVASSFPAPSIVESIGGMWDWVWIDGQHGQLDYHDILGCVRAADAAGTAPIVRVQSHDFGVIGRAADMAPAGIMVPMVNNAEEARAVVAALRFPPLGQRSFGGRRIIERGGLDFYKRVNDECVLVAQIETPEAVEHAEAIAATEGVDALFVGADDLKVRMDIPMTTAFQDSDALTKVMTTVAEAAGNTGKAAGCVTVSPETLRAALSLGHRLVACGSDGSFLRAESTNRRNAMDAVVAEMSAPGR